MKVHLVKAMVFPMKVHLVKVMVFPVAIYWYKSWTIKKKMGWTIKKAECQRINAFELWCWRTLESSWDSMQIKPVNPKGNQAWIFIGRTDAKAEAQYFGHLMRRADSKRPWPWERLKAAGEGNNRRWDGWMASWLNGFEFEKLWEREDREAWHATVHGVPKSQTWLSNWTAEQQQQKRSEWELTEDQGKWEEFCGSHSGPNIRPKWWGWEEEGPRVTVGLRNSIISRFLPLALFSCSFSFWSFIYTCALGWAAWVSI